MACSITLAGITIDCEANVGGIRKAWMIQHSDVKSVTVTSDKVSAIELEASKTWKIYNFRKGTGSMESTLNSDETTGINFFTTTVNLVFSKMDTAKAVEVNNLTKGQLAMVVLDGNGKYWYIGKDEYASASAATGATGTAKTDANGYTITITADSGVLPYELTEEAAGTLPTE